MAWRLSQRAQDFRDGKIRPAIDAIIRPKHGRNASEYEVAASAFVRTQFGGSYKWEFLINMWEIMWPGYAYLEKDGIVNDWCIRMAQEFCRSKRICLTGCASALKTGTSAMYGYTMWKTHPFNCSVFLTTTSGEAGESRGWGAVKDLWQLDQWRVGKRLDSYSLITLDEELKSEEGAKGRDFRDSIKAIKLKTGAEGQNAVGAICGRKNEFVVWIVDEAPFMDIGILDAEVNLFSNPFAQTIKIGNAPQEGDPLYIDAEPFGDEFPDGWRSVDKDLHNRWPTKKGICLYFNGDKSPNFKAKDDKPIPFPRLMNRDFKKEILSTSGGEDTPMYWKQFYGFPPSVDISDKVITYKLLETHDCFKEPEWSGESRLRVLAGMDVGFRQDGDPCIIYFGKLGKDTRLKTILVPEADGIRLNPSQATREDFELQIAKRVLEECSHRGCHDLAMDISSDGGIMLQAIQKEAMARAYSLNVVPISSLGSADERIVIPGERRTGKEMFVNLVSQHWMMMRLAVLADSVRGLKEQSKALSELCGRKFDTDENKRFKIEPKKEYKKRLRHSPDRADALAYLTVLAARNGLSFGPHIPQRPNVDLGPKASAMFGEKPKAAYSEPVKTARYGSR